MHETSKKIFLFGMLFFFLVVQGVAQILLEAEMTFKREVDNTISITATLYDTEEYDPVAELEVEFYSKVDSDSISIGSAITDEEGVVSISGVPFASLLLADDHSFNLTYFVPSSDEYVAGAETISLQELDMKLSFEEIDSVKKIVVTLTSWDEEGELTSIEDMDAYLYVPRLFSLLPIGEIYTEEGGIGMSNFPTDLPGGENGEMEVIVRIEDSDEYGNIEVSTVSNWGMPAADAADMPRALWSPRPPLWMIISFTLLMIGVWFHYVWIVVNMFKIRGDATEDDEINYEV